MSTEHPDDPGHGDSIAAWTAVIVITLAVTAATLAFWFEMYDLVWISSAFIPVGVVAGVVLARLGYGVKGKH